VKRSPLSPSSRAAKRHVSPSAPTTDAGLEIRTQSLSRRLDRLPGLSVPRSAVGDPKQHGVTSLGQPAGERMMLSDVEVPTPN
jgi:hypothetical protein